MAITPVTMYSSECNICKLGFETTHEGYTYVSELDSLMDDMTGQGWHIDDFRNCYCPKCHTIDENDELVLTPNENER